MNNLPDLFWSKDLKKSKRKENSNTTKIVEYVHCPFTEEMKEGQEGTVFYRRFHYHSILSLFITFYNPLLPLLQREAEIPV